MDNKDVFSNVLSFLQPIQLSKMRYLSSHHKSWSDIYLKKNMNMNGNKKNIEKYACPFCGNFINKDDLSNYTGFYYDGYSYMNEEKRIGQVEMTLSNAYLDIERKPLLCEDCESKEDYDDYVDIYEINTKMRYRGNREYNLHIMNNWAFISLVDYNEGKIYWDEYRKVILEDTFDYVYEYNSDIDSRSNINFNSDNEY